MIDQLTPMHNYILVRVERNREETKGAIVIASPRPRKSAVGIVEGVGPDADKGFKLGDRVLFPPFIGIQEESGAFEYRSSGVEYLFLLDESILATIGEYDPEQDPCPVCKHAPDDVMRDVAPKHAPPGSQAWAMSESE
jgi:co-chaperonin GroES (HSP10)